MTDAQVAGPGKPSDSGDRDDQESRPAAWHTEIGACFGAAADQASAAINDLVHRRIGEQPETAGDVPAYARMQVSSCTAKDAGCV